MPELDRMAHDAEQRLRGDPARMHAFADQIAAAAAHRSLITQASTATLCAKLRARAAQLGASPPQGTT